MASKLDPETLPTGKGAFWASSDPDLDGWILSWQNIVIPTNQYYRVWIGAKQVNGVVEGFRELTIQSFKDGYWNILDEEVRARLQLLKVNEIGEKSQGTEVTLTSDLFRNLRIGEILETHARAISSALSEDSNKGEGNKIRLYKPSIVRYSYMKFPESVLPKGVKAEIKYDSDNAILLAKLYCWLAETSESKLAKRTASILGIDVAIVHSAVKTARKQGWMTKAKKGKAGGQLTEEGERRFKSSAKSHIYETVINSIGGTR